MQSSASMSKPSGSKHALLPRRTLSAAPPPPATGKENELVCVRPPMKPAAGSRRATHSMPPINVQAANAVNQPFPRRSSFGPRDALAGMKQVDSDEDTSDDDDDLAKLTAERHQSTTGNILVAARRVSVPPSQNTTPIPSAPSSASSFRRSAAVSRQASDAAGTGFALLRGMHSAASTPTNQPAGSAIWGHSRSRSNSAVSITGHEGRVSREPSLLCGQLSRMSSMNASMSGNTTPELRMQAKTSRMEEAQQAVEDEIARRHLLFAPENVLVRKWLAHAILARSAKLLVESGGRRVFEYNAAQRARETLTRLFLPVCALHRVRRRRCAAEVIQSFILRIVVKLRLRKRHEATDRIRSFVSNKLAMFQHYAKYFKRCVVTVQRAFRAFKRRRDAMVELNCRFIRKVEGTYWESAATSALSILQEQYMRHVAEEKKKQQAKTGRRGSSIFNVDAVPPVLPPAFPTLASLGQFPETIVKKYLRPVITQRSRNWQREVSKRVANALETFKRTRRSSMSNIMKCPELCKRAVVVKLPPFCAFLTIAEVYQVLDDCAMTLAALRDAPVIALHLSDGHRSSPPDDTAALSTELSESSLRSDRLFESSLESRRCSVSDLLLSSGRR